jgi:tail collar domain
MKTRQGMAKTSVGLLALVVVAATWPLLGAQQGDADKRSRNDLSVRLFTRLDAARTAMKDAHSPGAIVGLCLPQDDYKVLPDNWCECDGRKLQPSAYPDLAKTLAAGRDSTGSDQAILVPDYRGFVMRWSHHDPLQGVVSDMCMDQLFVNGAIRDDRVRDVRWFMCIR